MVENCKNGTRCTVANCKSNHSCAHAAKCFNYYCKLSHPPQRLKPCRNGSDCALPNDCPYLHPKRKKAKDSNPISDKQCPEGPRCFYFDCKMGHAVSGGKSRVSLCELPSNHDSLCRFIHSDTDTLYHKTCPHRELILGSGLLVEEIHKTIRVHLHALYKLRKAGSLDRNKIGFAIDVSALDGYRVAAESWKTALTIAKRQLTQFEANILRLLPDCVFSDPGPASESLLSDVTRWAVLRNCYMLRPFSVVRGFRTYSQALPILGDRQSICQTIALHYSKLAADHLIMMIDGHTGAGKSTQLPQYLSLYFLSVGNTKPVACIQPHAMAAESVCSRVKMEYSCAGTIPIDELDVVCFSRESPDTVGRRITFFSQSDFVCYLLELLKCGTRFSQIFSCIILDDAQQRTCNSDAILGIYLKNSQNDNQGSLPLVVSSSGYTDIDENLNAGSLLVDICERDTDLKLLMDKPLSEINSSVYKHSAGKKAVLDWPRSLAHKLPSRLRTLSSITLVRLDITGKPFEVDIVYSPIEGTIQDKLYRTIQILWDILAQSENELFAKDHKAVDVLVFVPSKDDACHAAKMFAQRVSETPIGKEDISVAVLHEDLHPDEQVKLVETQRKCGVVFATSFAETSITLPNVKVVLDMGYTVETFYDRGANANYEKLVKISQVSAMQRSGRAGRTSFGVCYRLYHKDDFNCRRKVKYPQILDHPLEGLFLGLYYAGISEDFFWITPPTRFDAELALNRLASIGCLDPSTVEQKSKAESTAVVETKEQTRKTDNSGLTPLGEFVQRLCLPLPVGIILYHGTVNNSQNKLQSLLLASVCYLSSTKWWEKIKGLQKLMKKLGIRNADRILAHGDLLALYYTFGWLNHKAGLSKRINLTDASKLSLDGKAISTERYFGSIRHIENWGILESESRKLLGCEIISKLYETSLMLHKRTGADLGMFSHQWEESCSLDFKWEKWVLLQAYSTNVASLQDDGRFVCCALPELVGYATCSTLEIQPSSEQARHEKHLLFVNTIQGNGGVFLDRCVTLDTPEPLKHRCRAPRIYSSVDVRVPAMLLNDSAFYPSYLESEVLAYCRVQPASSLRPSSMHLVAKNEDLTKSVARLEKKIQTHQTDLLAMKHQVLIQSTRYEIGLGLSICDIDGFSVDSPKSVTITVQWSQGKRKGNGVLVYPKGENMTRILESLHNDPSFSETFVVRLPKKALRQKRISNAQIRATTHLLSVSLLSTQHTEATIYDIMRKHGHPKTITFFRDALPSVATHEEIYAAYLSRFVEELSDVVGRERIHISNDPMNNATLMGVSCSITTGDQQEFSSVLELVKTRMFAINNSKVFVGQEMLTASAQVQKCVYWNLDVREFFMALISQVSEKNQECAVEVSASTELRKADQFGCSLTASYRTNRVDVFDEIASQYENVCSELSIVHEKFSHIHISALLSKKGRERVQQLQQTQRKLGCFRSGYVRMSVNDLDIYAISGAMISQCVSDLCDIIVELLAEKLVEVRLYPVGVERQLRKIKRLISIEEIFSPTRILVRGSPAMVVKTLRFIDRHTAANQCSTRRTKVEDTSVRCSLCLRPEESSRVLELYCGHRLCPSHIQEHILSSDPLRPVICPGIASVWPMQNDSIILANLLKANCYNRLVSRLDFDLPLAGLPEWRGELFSGSISPVVRMTNKYFDRSRALFSGLIELDGQQLAKAPALKCAPGILLDSRTASNSIAVLLEGYYVRMLSLLRYCQAISSHTYGSSSPKECRELVATHLNPSLFLLLDQLDKLLVDNMGSLIPVAKTAATLLKVYRPVFNPVTCRGLWSLEVLYLAIREATLSTNRPSQEFELVRKTERCTHPLIYADICEGIPYSQLQCIISSRARAHLDSLPAYLCISASGAVSYRLESALVQDNHKKIVGDSKSIKVPGRYSGARYSSAPVSLVSRQVVESLQDGSNVPQELLLNLQQWCSNTLTLITVPNVQTMRYCPIDGTVWVPVDYCIPSRGASWELVQQSLARSSMLVPELLSRDRLSFKSESGSNSSVPEWDASSFVSLQNHCVFGQLSSSSDYYRRFNTWTVEYTLDEDLVAGELPRGVCRSDSHALEYQWFEFTCHQTVTDFPFSADRISAALERLRALLTGPIQFPDCMIDFPREMMRLLPRDIREKLPTSMDSSMILLAVVYPHVQEVRTSLEDDHQLSVGHVDSVMGELFRDTPYELRPYLCEKTLRLRVPEYSVLASLTHCSNVSAQ